MAENISGTHESHSQLYHYRLEVVKIVVALTASVLLAASIITNSLVQQPILPIRIHAENYTPDIFVARAFIGDRYSVNLLNSHGSITLSLRQEAQNGNISTLGASFDPTEGLPSPFLRTSK